MRLFRAQLQAFFHSLDFREFGFNAFYNSILFISPLVLLIVTSIYAVFALRVFFMCPHINSVNQRMPVHTVSTSDLPSPIDVIWFWQHFFCCFCLFFDLPRTKVEKDGIKYVRHEYVYENGPNSATILCIDIFVIAKLLAPSMSFYPDFISILSWFYPDFIQILSR